MPVYEYLCKKCGKTTEMLRRMNQADDPAECEHCGCKKVERAHSVFATGKAEEGGSPGGHSHGAGCGCCGGGSCGI